MPSRVQRRLQLLLLAVPVVAMVSALAYYYGRPGVWDSRLFTNFAGRMANVAVVDISDVSTVTNVEVYTQLQIGKTGMVVLLNATMRSFLAEDGPVILTQIGGCFISPVDLNGDSIAQHYPELRVTSVRQLVERYDAIYRELHVDQPDVNVDRPRCLPISYD